MQLHENSSTVSRQDTSLIVLVQYVSVNEFETAIYWLLSFLLHSFLFLNYSKSSFFLLVCIMTPNFNWYGPFCPKSPSCQLFQPPGSISWSNDTFLQRSDCWQVVTFTKQIKAQLQNRGIIIYVINIHKL